MEEIKIDSELEASIKLDQQRFQNPPSISDIATEAIREFLAHHNWVQQY